MNSKYNEIIENLQAKGYRLTDIRKAVIKILIEQEHISINGIITLLKKENENINIMSIYNTIDLLSTEHIIHADVVANNKVFELSDNIIHVVCNMCNKIIYEVKGQKALQLLNMQKIRTFLKTEKDFDFSHFDLEIHGLCKDCQNKSKKT